MKPAIVLFSMFVVLPMIGACAIQPSRDPVPEPETGIALLVANGVERLAAAGSYWPLFDPVAVPLAIYDGQRTYLFRHPAAPEGFAATGDGSSVLAFEGRHPAVTANSSTEIGGTATATLMIDESAPKRRVTELAGIAIHEAFHVFQRERHPDWIANEADLFVYPVDDAELLALRRRETEALRRALASSDPAESRCWARLALALRAERYSAMDPAFAAYERGTELNEGLATYVEIRAAGSGHDMLPQKGFAAADVRSRGYATGAALGLLLDRTDALWPERLADGTHRNLDEALNVALSSARENTPRRCSFTDEELSDSHRQALEDVAELVAGRAARRASFDTTAGWRLVVKSLEGAPLWPQGFDPLNVTRVQGGVLHSRFLRVGNGWGHVQVIDAEPVDIEALTISAGSHPLFEGVAEVSIAGFAEHSLEAVDGRVAIRVPGLEMEFEPAVVQRDGRTTVVVLLPRD